MRRFLLLDAMILVGATAVGLSVSIGLLDLSDPSASFSRKMLSASRIPSFHSPQPGARTDAFIVHLQPNFSEPPSAARQSIAAPKCARSHKSGAVHGQHHRASPSLHQQHFGRPCCSSEEPVVRELLTHNTRVAAKHKGKTTPVSIPSRKICTAARLDPAGNLALRGTLDGSGNFRRRLRAFFSFPRSEAFRPP